MSHSTPSSVDKNNEIVRVQYCTYIKVKKLRRNNTYLLKELLEDVKKFMRGT